MRFHPKNCCLFILLCLFHSVSAQNNKDDNKKSNEVWALTNKLAKAMTDADNLTLDQLTSNQLIYGHSSGAADNKQEFIAKLVSGKSDFVSINLEEPQIAISGNTAIVRHILRAETSDNHVPGKVNLRVMLVWLKSKHSWKLIARQAVKIPG